MRPLTVWILLAGAAASVARAQPDDLARWDLICYCSATVNTPHFAVFADSNGRILYYAQTGATRAVLERATGTRVTVSQLEFLRAWRLLSREGDVYTTSIPVLGPEAIGRLRVDMRRLAERLVPGIVPDLHVVTEELDRRKLHAHLYAVVFSLVLDGLTWDALDSARAVPEIAITAEHPFWDGVFWAVYPKRDAAPGTNSGRVDSLQLLMTWTERVLDPLASLRKTLDLSSAPIPVIHKNQSDSIFVAGMRIAGRIAAAVVAYDTAQRAHVIDTHELIWEILDALVARGLLQQPAVLRAGPTTPEHLLPLLVLTDR